MSELKKIFLAFVVMIFASVSFASSPPAKLIIPNKLNGEVNFDITAGKKWMKPKMDVIFYQEPSSDSEVAFILKKDNTATAMGSQLHTYPYQSKQISTEDSTIYFLYYDGEGFYSVWADYGNFDKIFSVQLNSNKIKITSDLWIMAKDHKSKKIGWTQFYGFNNWYSEPGSGVFLSPDLIDKAY